MKRKLKDADNDEEGVVEKTKKARHESTNKPKALSTLQIEMKKRLEGGQFRFLNEELYTKPSDESFAKFNAEPSLFDSYHRGFREQVEKWPLNPVDVFIKFCKKHPSFVVGDFGCGDAKLAESVENEVHSFDLVAVNERVTPCDIAHVPLEDNLLDVAIFSLSLMGLNWSDFIIEARRVLKFKGRLMICEVKSRFEEPAIGGIDGFIKIITKMGFEFKKQDVNNKMFVFLGFEKNSSNSKKTNKNINNIKNNSIPSLGACKYKRR